MHTMFARSRILPRWRSLDVRQANPFSRPRSVRYASSASAQPFSYGAMTGPFFKVFLGASFIYQAIYWSWLKLEMDDFRVERQSECVLLLFQDATTKRMIEELAVLENKVQELSIKQ